MHRVARLPNDCVFLGLVEVDAIALNPPRMYLWHGCQTAHDRGTIHLLRSGDFHLSLARLLALLDLHPNRAALLIAIRPHLRLLAAAVAITGHESLLERPQKVVEIA